MSAYTTVPAGREVATLAGGCFWCLEAVYDGMKGVESAESGYMGGHSPNPTYEEVCSGLTGHTEVVLVVFDPTRTDYAALLRIFWEAHDPTQGMRQGNDVGTQYRSAIYTHGAAQRDAALASRDAYQARLAAAGHGPITSEIADAPEFYYAEGYPSSTSPRTLAAIAGTGERACAARTDGATNFPRNGRG